ncbi:MAG: pseudouridine-5'-phosphate glycosidase [Clostridia bacterium]|nr:pseudouridine-5'-phosphate glycosidase [Clostridia bacterium]
MNPEVILSDEVREALAAGEPVIALESALLTHGLPYPENVKTVVACARLAKRHGAVAAVCAVINGKMHVGLTDEQVDRLGKLGQAVPKVSRMDLPYVAANGLDGGTTVAASMIIAKRAGIKLLATGGIGGVNRGGHITMDISADLTELGRTPVAVVCAGPKGILDTGRTLEYLETQGVPVVVFRSDRMPAFLTPDCGVAAPLRLDSVEELAAMVESMDELELGSGMVVANPIPEKFVPDKDMIEKATLKAFKEAERANIEGRELTPFMLNRISELTNGESRQANIALIYNNVRLAALIAVQLSKRAEGKPH